MTDHFNRRSVLATAVAVAAASVGEAEAATTDIKIDANNLSNEMKKKHAVRFPNLDQESLMNFAEGIRRWQLGDKESADSVAKRNVYLAAKGHDPAAETKLSHEESWNLLMQYPAYAARTRIEWANHDFMYDVSFRHYHANRDKYLAMLEATDKAGPGKLELNPDMVVPEYTTHEIHRMPGGYVGDPFAGFAYHWTITGAYYAGPKYDESHTRMAQACRLPEDGEVKRILDVGCSAGMSTTAFKERFPDAEVWGIDVGGPMVRYAHHRASKMGLACNFAQRLAEDPKFPDNHFDVVFDFLLTHEVTNAAARKIANEMFRVMRPGGIWMHNDLPREDMPQAGIGHTVSGKARVWNTHRHNYEPWYFRYVQDNFPAMLKDAGFELQVDKDARGGFINALYAIKPLKA